MDLNLLKRFRFQRILNQDPITQSVAILGALPTSNVGSQDQSDSSHDYSPAILRIERLPLPVTLVDHFDAALSRFELTEHTDIYAWGKGWLDLDDANVKINVIHPATDTHIRKVQYRALSLHEYTKQEMCMVRESPEIYERITKPYMLAFPPSRIQWVYNILSGASEEEKVLYKDSSPEFGFIILPDMKWDGKTIPTLYLVALVLSKGIRSLRDLEKRHLGMLRNIRKQAAKIVQEKWGLDQGSLRLYVHYQPSYYHFHVHIVHVEHVGTVSSTVGQGHLLEDIISLLELSPDEGPSILERMTLTYALGEHHGLFKDMVTAQALLG